MGGKKSGGGFLGIGGQSGLLNTGLFASGPQKIKGFEMSNQLRNAEERMITRQEAIANGTGPSIAKMAFNANLDQTNRQAMAIAASQRGASNPMLAFRQAQIGNQQMGLEGAQQAAIMAEEERRRAEQLIAAQAAAARGVAFNQATTNLGALQSNQQMNAQALAGLAQVALTPKDKK